MENYIRKCLALSVVYLKKSCYEAIELKIMPMCLGEAGTAYHSLESVLLVGSVLLIIFKFSVLCFWCFVCLRPVSCVPNVAGVSGLPILDCPFGFLQRYCTYCQV
jgi:hypothetical protein